MSIECFKMMGMQVSGERGDQIRWLHRPRSPDTIMSNCLKQLMLKYIFSLVAKTSFAEFSAIAVLRLDMPLPGSKRDRCWSLRSRTGELNSLRKICDPTWSVTTTSLTHPINSTYEEDVYRIFKGPCVIPRLEITTPVGHAIR